MARLGFDDSTPIESGMVTGAITQAQVKVEGRNFDIRKRALEFDDVLNNQRNVIYDQRRQILEKGNVRETVLGFLQDEAAAMVDSHAVSPDPEEWDREGLAAALGAMLSRAGEITAATFAEAGSQDELREKVAELVDETYEQRETALGDELARVVERWILLRTIDIHWVEHLTAMEELREGIYLRGYGQQDPLVAYKREAHTFFEEMSARIASGVAQQILRVTVKTAEQAEREEQEQAKVQQGQAQPQRAFAQSGNGKTAVATAAPASTKLGRNDPCWCGSGKKFKKCHGR
jgi:preprotein translocase subunit SecA